MAGDNIQKKLRRVRAPRVQLSYEVQVGDATHMKELPFAMGVLGDFTGNSNDLLPTLKDRCFVEVTPHNFDQVIEKMKPHLAFSVTNHLEHGSDASPLKIDLAFKRLEDFEPGQVAGQVRPIAELLDLRKKLSDLSVTLQTNNKLDKLLVEAVKNIDFKNKLKAELEIESDGQHS